MDSALLNYVSGFEDRLKLLGDPAVAEGAAKYMRNLSPFIGVKAPVRRQVMKEYMEQEGLPSHTSLSKFVEICWERPYREMQYFGMEVANKVMKKPLKEDIVLIEFMIVGKSWWDTVDFIAAHLAGGYFKTFREEMVLCTRRWMDSSNRWLQRSALLFQLNWKQETDVELLFEYIEELSSVKEFFIEKAIGWALRQLSRTYPEEVRNFVATHALRPLSRREATKRIYRQG
ncbi:MAG: DNA alkylation repair protein [Bacteroidales bacterium]|nr:DNA alkylation repair protein [Bacteroidales bacterium]